MHLRLSAVDSVLSSFISNHYQHFFNRRCTQINADVVMRGVIIKENWTRNVSNISNIEYANIGQDEQDLQDGQATHILSILSINLSNAIAYLAAYPE